jgi:hypothetical protein
MLSAGEMLALDASKIAMLLYERSNTSRNLARDGRLTLTLPLDHGLCEMRLRATAKKQEGRRRCFTALVEDVRQYRSHNSDVVSGVTFRLHARDIYFGQALGHPIGTATSRRYGCLDTK